MRPHRILTGALLAALVAIAVTPPAVTAQDTDLATAIDRNEELLREATALVRETNSVKARAALEVARKLHEGSKSMFAAGNRLMAGRTVMEAREAILRAIAIARQEVKLEEGARRAIERARNRLEQAGLALDDAGPTDDPTPRKLIDEARSQLQRAHDNMQEHMFEIALRLANASAELSGRALQMLRRGGLEPDRLLEELNRTDTILARIAERRGDIDANARALIAEARRLQERARENARAGNPRLALEQTRRARGLALRLMQSAGPDDETDALSAQRALRFTDEVIDRARRRAGEDARERLEEAIRIQERAKARLEQGDAGAATRLTQQARALAKDAVLDDDRPVDAAAVRSALATTDEALQRASEAVRNSGDEEARELLRRATRRQEEARAAFEDGRLRRALALTKVARNLATNAMRHTEDDNG